MEYLGILAFGATKKKNDNILYFNTNTFLSVLLLGKTSVGLFKNN